MAKLTLMFVKNGWGSNITTVLFLIECTLLDGPLLYRHLLNTFTLQIPLKYRLLSCVCLWTHHTTAVLAESPDTNIAEDDAAPRTSYRN